MGSLYLCGHNILGKIWHRIEIVGIVHFLLQYSLEIFYK